MLPTRFVSRGTPPGKSLPGKRACFAAAFRVRHLAAIVIVLGGPLGAHAGMTTGMQISGSVGYELAGIASPGPPVSGSITLSTIPLGAMPLFVFIYSNDFLGPMGIGGGQIDATFTPLVGPAINIAKNMSPNSSDPVPISQTWGYKIGVPPNAVIGNGSYGINIAPSFMGGNANQWAGAGMLVIYSHPMLPQSTITVNDGVFMMGTGGMPNSQTTTFQQMSDTIHASANSSLSLLTFADDPFTTGEQIKFNGSVIGGPIDANLPGTGSASIFNFTVTSLAGSSNTANLTSTGDVFGWHVAVLQTPVPEPSGFLLATAGLLGLAYFGRRFRVHRLAT
jgi:hypothetical protein